MHSPLNIVRSAAAHTIRVLLIYVIHVYSTVRRWSESKYIGHHGSGHMPNNAGVTTLDPHWTTRAPGT